MDPHRDLESRAFAGNWRVYQQQALDAFDADVAAGDNRAYLVLPPGAGKTMIGLEAARRLGRRSLVLVPNTAVQAQWAAAWDNSFPSSDRSASKCGTERGLASAMNVLTYQSLAVIDAETDSTVRREVLRNRDQQALLDLLHPNGRAVIERAATLGPWTLVLDECHHLLATWGALVSALASVLGAQTALIGLTATPATELTAWQHTLHDELFGTADFVIPTPALVREGDLAPYQELVYLTQPTPEEQAWIGTHRARFADLMLALIDQKVGSMSLAAWLHTRIVDRATREGNQIAWSTFERAEPDLACSGLRFAYDGLIPLPDGVRLREQHRIAPDAQDWVNVLTDFSVGHLQQSADPRDAHALTAIKRVLPGLGYRLTSRGVRVATSPVDRLCALSESKIAATAHILDTEDAVLGARLRALVLCDFESMTGALPTSLKGAPVSEQSGSAQLVAAMLAASDHRRRTPLHALLVTGQTFACPAAIEDDLIAFCAERGALVTAEPLDAHPSLRVMRGTGGFTPRTWVALATEYFLAGRARVLVGTRSLLGEGWDCAAVNVNIDLTSATTQAAITQMRGRAIRNDPSDGHKVADNWSVCCIATEHPRGDADYLRLVRKHDGYYAATPQGLIESGVTHCDPSLSPYGPPVTDTHAITARALQRVAERAQARSWWRIGEPYEGVDVATIRVRSRQPLGVAAPRIPASALTPPVRDSSVRSAWQGVPWPPFPWSAPAPPPQLPPPISACWRVPARPAPSSRRVLAWWQPLRRPKAAAWTTRPTRSSNWPPSSRMRCTPRAAHSEDPRHYGWPPTPKAGSGVNSTACPPSSPCGSPRPSTSYWRRLPNRATSSDARSSRRPPGPLPGGCSRFVPSSGYRCPARLPGTPCPAGSHETRIGGNIWHRHGESTSAHPDNCQQTPHKGKPSSICSAAITRSR
ncbi:Type III restriction enzyme%2C res subunit [Mycobacterium tuberculosis]|nr:Type III restriction enzyme%2C res subunit [Mycobacterium tuberculosis]